MSDIYVFSPSYDDDDYDSMGLCGALSPTECTFEETANGESILTLNHPIDEYERYSFLQRGYILVVPVPVRTTPEIQNGKCVSVVWKYKIKSSITGKAQRTLYKKNTGKKRKKLMKAGDEFTVVYKSQDDEKRWKVKTKYGTGWMNSDSNGVAYDLITTYTGLENNANVIQEIQSPWTVADQYFRIYETKKNIDSISVSARHISYDLLYNVTRYENGNEVKLQDALNGVLNNCYSSHGFKAYTNITNVQTGIYYNGKNPIEAFLDPEEGICSRYKVDLIRDNDELYFLDDPGINRGVQIRYSKNMTGVDFTESEDEVATRIIPVGEKKNGDPLYLDADASKRYIDIETYVKGNKNLSFITDTNPNGNVPKYAIPHVYYLKCDNCKVGDKDSNGGKITEKIAKDRMREQANKKFDEECYNPKIQMSVEFLNLGDTEEYKQFKNLENSFLFDYVIVQHPRLNINVTAQIVKIKWDCLRDRMTGVEIGSVGETIGNVGITSWQIPAGFSGSKIAAGSIGSSALGEDIISAKHIQAETINAQMFNAKTITTDELYATLAHIAAAEINNATIEEANINHLNVKEAALELASIAHAKIEEAEIDTANIDTANVENANIQKLAATLAEIERATIDYLSSDRAEIDNALIDWANIQNLTAQTAAIAKANIGDVSIDVANINWAQIETLSNRLADIAQARINHADIDQAVINQLTADVTSTVTLTAKNADVDFATAQRLVTSAMIMDQGVGGSLTIKNLVATSAMFVQATMGTLTLKGSDGKYYNVVIESDGTMHTEEVTVSASEIAAGETASGRKIVETQALIEDLNSTNIKAQSIITRDIFTAALTAGKISASQAFLASATIPTLYATAIKAIGDTLDLSANESINLVVGGAMTQVKTGGRNYLRESINLFDSRFYTLLDNRLVVALADEFEVDEDICVL